MDQHCTCCPRWVRFSNSGSLLRYSIEEVWIANRSTYSSTTSPRSIRRLLICSAVLLPWTKRTGPLPRLLVLSCSPKGMVYLSKHDVGSGQHGVGRPFCLGADRSMFCGNVYHFSSPMYVGRIHAVLYAVLCYILYTVHTPPTVVILLQQQWLCVIYLFTYFHLLCNNKDGDINYEQRKTTEH